LGRRHESHGPPRYLARNARRVRGAVAADAGEHDDGRGCAVAARRAIVGATDRLFRAAGRGRARLAGRSRRHARIAGHHSPGCRQMAVVTRPYREKVVTFGAGRGLVGIVTLPGTPRPDAPQLLLINSGIIHRVGANRLYVSLARTLAAAGV